MSHYNVKPLEISLHPSWALATLLICLHGLVQVLAICMPLPWAASWLVRLILVVALSASLAYHLMHQVFRCLHRSIIGLKLATDGSLSIALKNGNWRSVKVLGSSFVHPVLTILNLQVEAWYFPVNVILMPDALDADAFRRLRVWLKWGVKDLPDEWLP